jgi:hypothetical protein
MADQNRPFHERFDIEVGLEEARRRFVNRVSNTIYSGILHSDLSLDERRLGYKYVANELGERYINQGFSDFIAADFVRCLQVTEAVYDWLQQMADTGYSTQQQRYGEIRDSLSSLVERILDYSETDLGIDWQPPVFVPTGARLLDERLVNEQLRWLSDPQYRTVYEPFEKGLSHFLETERKPQLLPDVVTDMYESVEALAKIVTGKPNKDLSGNRELFVSKVKASDHYKTLLKDYIAYANEFRHAERKGRPRPTLSRPEVESFVYLTGLFIRLAAQRS